MRLKEAQMLGVLCLIAVAIFLLAVWGGEDELSEPGEQSPAELVEQDEMIEPTITELYEELLWQEQEPVSQAEPAPVEEATMAIGGAAPAPEPSEEAVIRTVIERAAPEQIPLTPVKPDPVEPQRSAPTEPPKPRYHVVQKGETLSEISKRYYGTVRKWREILEANRDVVPDERLLRPGTRLKIPGAADAEVAAAAQSRPALSSTASAASPGRTYTVQKGDTLYRIAEKFYGDGSRWKDIHQANRALIPEARLLRPGMELVIP
jgi:nucleoid-associated protein YgaU